jgi:O-antigen ligase
LSGYLWKGNQEKKYQENDYWQITAMILVLLGVVVSLVRHLWGALAVIFVLWLWYLTKEKRLILFKFAGRIFLTVGVFFILYVWLFSLIGGNITDSLNKPLFILKQRTAMSSIVNLADSSFAWRVSAWRAGFGMFLHSPIWGTGLGQNIFGYAGVTPFEVPARDLHNNYLGILVQLGLLGLGAVGYWFIYLLKMLNSLWQKFKDQNSFVTRLLFTWGSTVILFMIVFAVSVYWDMNLFIIWWWVALASVRWISLNQDVEAIKK